MKKINLLQNKKYYSRIYWFAIAILFIVLVLCKVNLSNIGVWEERIQDRPEDYSYISIGIPKKIRSDEYIVNTPLIKSFADQGFPVVNPLIRDSGFNGLVSNIPTKHIVSIMQPLHWGYLLFGFDYGFSWYWMGLIFLLLITSFELVKILTKGNIIISLFGAAVITFSAPIVWWSLFPTIAQAQLIIVAAVSFLKSRKLSRQIWFALLGVFGFTGLMASLYPAFVIPLLYLSLVFCVTILIRDRAEIDFTKIKLLILSGAVLSFLVILYFFYQSIHSEIEIMRNTVYPGARISTGGDTPLYYFSMFINIFKQNLQALNYLNNSEASSFFNYSIPILILLITTKTRKSEIWPFIGFAVFIYLYTFFGLPDFLAGIMGMKMTTGFRAINFAHLSLLYVSLIILSEWKDREVIGLKGKIGAVLLVLFWGLFLYEALSSSILSITHGAARLGTLAYFLMWALSFVLKRKKLFMIITATVVVFFGMTVNPVSFGAQALINTNLGNAVQEIGEEYPDSRWISIEGGSANYLLYANGVHSLSGVHTYPDIALWEKLDPEGLHSDYYNRFAHIGFIYGSQKTERFRNPYPDVLEVVVTLNDLVNLEVEFFVSLLSPERFGGETLTVEKLYGPDKDGFYIYRIIQNGGE